MAVEPDLCDDFDYEEPKVIFLQGVFSRDNKTVDDAFYDNLTASIAKSEVIVYNKIPRKFYNIETWIRTTNIHCCTCDRKIESRPTPICVNLKILGDIKTFDVLRLCCSFPCYAEFIEREAPFDTRWEMREHMFTVFEIFHNKQVSHIPCGPSRLEQARLGGNLSDAEYQKKIDDITECLLMDDTEDSDSSIGE